MKKNHEEPAMGRLLFQFFFLHFLIVLVNREAIVYVIVIIPFFEILIL